MVERKKQSIFELLDNLREQPLSETEKLYKEIIAQISGEIMVYRKEHNLTQEQLADILGVSQEMVSRIESGKENLSLKRLVEISLKLGGKPKVSLGILKDQFESDCYDLDETTEAEFPNNLIEVVFTAA
ncbi:MAG: helix-turn-helix domain-containing protein [Thermotogae bacterium]|nr:helix-turn-helix domain-containing protein [Thermotogota bacterium]